ncbi:MAG: BatD family protein [Saprospiraceae bacterium]
MSYNCTNLFDRLFSLYTLSRYALVGFALSLLLLSPQMAKAQRFEAYADAKQVLLRSYFDITFTLYDSDGKNFQPPAFTNFTVISGPSQSVSTTIINGRMSKELGITYTLQPKQIGTFTIDKAKITVGNKTIETKPISIKVVEGNGNNDAQENVYIEAIPSTTDVWVGQQIILDYKLYTSVQIETHNVISESDYQGFYAQDIRRYDSRVVREVIKGSQYATKVFKRLALFPQQTGNLTIEPLNVQLGAVVDDNNQRRSFFFSRQIRRIPASTAPIIFNVKPLPSNAPASFTGAVGHFEVSTSINRNTITTDDALSVVISIRGNGDIKRIQAPNLEFPEVFEVYDPKILKENSFENIGELYGEKEIEYLLVPKTPGQYELTPEFTYFNPDSAKYITFKENTFFINVRQGTQQKAAELAPIEKEKERDIEYIKTTATFDKAESYFLGSSLFWIFSVLPLLLLGGAFAYKQMKAKNESLDPAILRKRRARKAAQKRLETAHAHLQAKQSKAFYDEVSRAMLDYVCDKLQIPRSELTKDNVRERLHALQVADSEIERFMKTIQTCEMALYAGMDNTSAMQETYEQTVDLLATVEASMK